jgi:hypothetical protein
MKLADFRRIGAALFVALGVIAPTLGLDFGPEDAEKAAGAWNEMVVAGSGFMAVVLALWSKFTDGKRE